MYALVLIIEYAIGDFLERLSAVVTVYPCWRRRPIYKPFMNELNDIVNLWFLFSFLFMQNIRVILFTTNELRSLPNAHK